MEFSAPIESVMGAIDEEGKALNNANQPQYQFMNTDTIKLDEIHKLIQGPVKVNVKECMEYIMKVADFDKVANDGLVDEHLDLIERLAASEDTVRLLDKTDDGKLPLCLSRSTHNATQLMLFNDVLISNR